MTSSLPKRTVTFSPQPIIFFINYYEDRKGPWETITVDRVRFNNRIKEIENKIGWCLESSHRDKIFNNLKYN